MSKRISISATTFAAFIFAMIGLFTVIAAAQAPDEPQQRAIDTTKLNMKNTSKKADAVLVVELNKASGGKVASREVGDLDRDGEVSASESAFDFGVPPEDHYVLTIRRGGKTMANDSWESDVKASVTVTGTVGGKISAHWNLKTNNKRVSPAGSLSGIKFKTDGKTPIAGRIEFKGLG